jgi:hypothetical protein
MFVPSFPSPASSPPPSYSNVEQPDSPTSSLYVVAAGTSGYDQETTTLKSTTRVSSSSSARRGVNFAASVKCWDGLQATTNALDKLITRYFVRQMECSELDVIEIASHNLDLVDQLYLDLQDLAVRIELAVSSGQTCEPVLPRGGGANVKLSLPHLPYVRILSRVVAAAQSRLKQAQMMDVVVAA